MWCEYMKLLDKEKIEDSMMRIKEKSIASELMELTFGLKV